MVIFFLNSLYLRRRQIYRNTNEGARVVSLVRVPWPASQTRTLVVFVEPLLWRRHSKTGAQQPPRSPTAATPSRGVLSLSEARSLSPPRFSGSLMYWVTRPINIKVTCARSGQANHHTDHALSMRHPCTPGPITADFLWLVFSSTGGNNSLALSF